MQENLVTLSEKLSIILSDYKLNEKNDVSHVLRWAQQFPEEDRDFLLKQTISLMEKSYYSLSKYKDILNSSFFKDIPENTLNLIRNSSFLELQKQGSSQNELILIMKNEFLTRYKIYIKINEHNLKNFYYIDDFSFTGDRAYNDISYWIENNAPQCCSLNIIFIADHTYGRYNLNKKLIEKISQSSKKINLSINSIYSYKNDLSNKNMSDVFWLTHNNFYNRMGFQQGSFIFDDEKNRTRFEEILYNAGMYIISLCVNPKNSIKPMGYSRISKHTGFGGTIFTYRNCPNTAPLAFWWGNPNVSQSSPLSKWYPLFIRKTYD